VGPKRKEESIMLHVQAIFMVLFYHWLDISMPNATFFFSHTVAGVHALFQACFLILSSALSALSVMYSLKF